MNPADEVVAIVDAENRVTGAATRRQMRAEGLLHRASYILVYNSQGEIYVQKRTLTKDVYPGYWDPCTGGVVLAGESYEESAIRELEEEMGVHGVSLATHGDFYFEADNLRIWGRIFSCIWDGPIVPQPEEVQYVEPMMPQAILARAGAEDFTPDGLYVIARALGRL